MKKVLVSQRVDVFRNRSEIRDALDQNLVRLLLECGLIPIPVPNRLLSVLGETEFSAQIESLDIHGLVLSGGNDIGEFPERDGTEGALLKLAMSRRKPVLGICRGMQIICSHFGAQLMEVTDHVNCRHGLLGLDNHIVNSFHNFGVQNCPPGLRTLATAHDGTIEAIQAVNYPIFGIMWHPEREKPFRSVDLGMIRKIFGC